MAYTAQTGTGAILTMATVAMVVREMSFTFDRETIDSTALVDYYKTNVAGRYSASFSATCLLGTSTNAENSILLGYQSQTSRGSAVAFSYSDATASNVYTGSCIITKVTHNTKGDDVDTVTIEFTVTGSVA